ncbi:MAG: Rab family GTPase [Dichotomicrobium sp.]
MPASCKIMMLGEIGVGKTSIVRRLVLGKFDANYKATLGVDMYTYTLDSGDFADRPVELVIWDIDGDIGENIFGHVYIQGASGALVVGDATRPSTHPSMVTVGQQFQEYLPGRPLMLVLNKMDLVPDPDALDAALLERTGKAPLETTSAKTGENVARAFHNLTKEVMRRGL